MVIDEVRRERARSDEARRETDMFLAKDYHWWSRKSKIEVIIVWDDNRW